MLYAADGSVVRSSERTARAERQEAQEEEIRAKLKSIDELLDIQYLPWAGRYVLMCKWPQSDARWKMYESGEISSPFDNLGWFCEDMHDGNSLPVSLDSIENKVLDLLAKCDNTVAPWKVRMRQLVEKNAKVRKSRQQAVIDKAQNAAEVLWQAVGRHDANKVEQIMQEIADSEE